MISLLTAYFIVYIPYWLIAKSLWLNDVRGISMLSAKIGEQRKQVTARYLGFLFDKLSLFVRTHISINLYSVNE